VGVLLFLLGPAVYAVQIGLKHLSMPWYLPLLASVGVLFMLISVWRRRGIWRISLCVLFSLLCGFEWFLMLVAFNTPAYAGPPPGAKVPAFSTTLADGKPFTNKDLESGMPAVLVFFRGRW
jgi:hypothetical protein